MMMPSIFGNNFVDDVFDDMFPFAGNYTTANYDLMKTDVKDAGDHYECRELKKRTSKQNWKMVTWLLPHSRILTKMRKINRVTTSVEKDIAEAAREASMLVKV